VAARDHSRTVSFPGHSGVPLVGRMDLSPGPALGYAIFASCFTCSKDVLTAVRIGQVLASRGIAVLRFDFTGLGSSGGEFGNTSFSSNLEDLVCAAAFLRAQYQAPRLLVGHSLGGAAVLAAAARMPEVMAVATIAAPSDPAHVRDLLAHAVGEIEARGEAAVRVGANTVTIGRVLLEDISEQRLLEAVAELKRALIVFHSPRDRVVDIEHARHIYQAARHPKSFISLDDADHLLSRAEDARYVAELLAVWASRYL
jgi:alpha-beta hydrolase superfamily lysophospholipase